MRSEYRNNFFKLKESDRKFLLLRFIEQTCFQSLMTKKHGQKTSLESQSRFSDQHGKKILIYDENIFIVLTR